MLWEAKKFEWFALLRYSLYCGSGTEPTISSKYACKTILFQLSLSFYKLSVLFQKLENKP